MAPKAKEGGPAPNGTAAAGGKGGGKQKKGGDKTSSSTEPTSSSNAASKAESSSATASSAATPSTTTGGASAAAASGRQEKPDKIAYDQEMKVLRDQIDAKQAEKDKVDAQIKELQSGGAGERRKALKTELDELSSNRKNSRSNIFDQVNAKKEALEKKKKDLQTSKGKIPYKNLEDLENHIKQLEKQVDSGTMKLGDEKRALSEISASKRLRRNLEAFQTEQDAISKEQAAIDELKTKLDDPELKAAQDRVDTIRAELDKLKKNDDEHYANKDKLYDQRNALKNELNALYNQKREVSSTYKEANDRYYEKVNEDRQRRAEQAKARRKVEDEEKKRAKALKLREEAEFPAFAVEIEDCQVLIDFFSGKGTGVKDRAGVEPSAKVTLSVTGIPELEIRQVDTAPAAGFVQFKKKSQDDDVYFAGTKGKFKGGKKSGGKAKTANGSANPDGETNGDASTPSTPADKLQLSIGTYTALMKLSIPPPSSPAEVPRVVEDLKTKKAWYEANQDRATQEEIAKAEKKIKELDGEPAPRPGRGPKSTSGSATPASVSTPAAVIVGENPLEPIPTPVATDELSSGVETEKVDEVLDGIKHQSATTEIEAES